MLAAAPCAEVAPPHIAGDCTLVPQDGHIKGPFVQYAADRGRGFVEAEGQDRLGHVKDREGLPQKPDQMRRYRFILPDGNGRRVVTRLLQGLRIEATGTLRMGCHGLFIKPGVPFLQHIEQVPHLRQIDPCELLVVAAYVLTVVNQVRELNRLGGRSRRGEMLQVLALTGGPVAVCRPAHVRQRFHELRHGASELALHILERAGGVLNNIVKPGSGQRRGIIGHRCHELRHVLEMHCVGQAGVFPPVHDARVLMYRKIPCPLYQFVHIRPLHQTIAPYCCQP